MARALDGYLVRGHAFSHRRGSVFFHGSVRKWRVVGTPHADDARYVFALRSDEVVLRGAEGRRNLSALGSRDQRRVRSANDELLSAGRLLPHFARLPGEGRLDGRFAGGATADDVDVGAGHLLVRAALAEPVGGAGGDERLCDRPLSPAG